MCGILLCDRSFHAIAILLCGVRKAASRNFVVSVLYVEFYLSYRVKTFLSFVYLLVPSSLPFPL